jgi:hypothetical protein
MYYSFAYRVDFGGGSLSGSDAEVIEGVGDWGFEMA